MSRPATLESIGNAPASGRPPLHSLTGLRFLAALHVLLFHAQEAFPHAVPFQLPHPFTNWFASGYVGVSLFFILSGFILAYNYLESDLTRPEQRARFWISRFARVYPIYLLGLAVAAPKFIYACLGSDAAASLGESAATGIAVVSLTQAWSPGQALAWNAPGWSLSVEAFFYLLFPLLAMRIARVRRKGALVGVLVSWVASLLPPTLYYALVPESALWANVVKFNPLVRLPEFILGVCLGKLFLYGLAQPGSVGRFRWYPGWIAVMVLGVLLLHDSVPKLFIHNALMAPLFGWLIYSLACQDHLAPRSCPSDRFVRLLRCRALILLGEASYALYILHVPIKGLFLFGVDRVIGTTGSWGVSLLLALYSITTLVAAIAAFKLLEVPARRWIKDRFTQKAKRSLALETCLSQPARNPSL